MSILTRGGLWLNRLVLLMLVVSGLTDVRQAAYAGEVGSLTPGAVPANAIPVQIVAIEYPPYTSSHIKGHGLAFDALNRVLQTQAVSGVKVVPLILPPGRASRLMAGELWDASFYPPAKTDRKSFKQIRLGDHPIYIGLFRLRQAEPFSWGELKALSGGLLGLSRSESQTALRQTLEEAGLRLVPSDSLGQAFRQLQQGRVDYVLAEQVAGYQAALAQGFNHNDLQFSENTLQEMTINLWVNTLTPAGAHLFRQLKPAQP